MDEQKMDELSRCFERYRRLEVEIKQLNLLATKAADGVGEIEFTLQVIEPIEQHAALFCEAKSIGEIMRAAREEKPTRITTAFHKESISDSLTLEILGCLLHEKNLEKEWLEKKVRTLYNETFNP